MRVISSLIIAFATYSRIPMPRADWSQENRRYAMCFFPLIGAVIGAALWGWLWLCGALGFGPLLQGTVGALIPLLVTGGIHMDGFMDTCDALASWQSRERRLEILKDSHTGAFAVMGCCAYMMAAAGLLSEAALSDAPMLGMVFVCSRTLSAVTSVTLRGARQDGMLAGFAQTASTRAVAASGAVYAALCLLVFALAGGWLALPCALAAVLCVYVYRRMAYTQFGGVTGDLAGWLLETAELTLIAVIIAGGKIL